MQCPDAGFAESTIASRVAPHLLEIWRAATFIYHLQLQAGLFHLTEKKLGPVVHIKGMQYI